MNHAFSFMFKNFLASPKSGRFLCFSPRVLYFYLFHIKSMIHFDLIFVYKVWDGSKVSISALSSCSSTICCKGPCLLYWIAFTLLSKISWVYLCVSVSEFSILFHWYINLFFYQYDTVCLLNCLEIFLSSLLLTSI
jgi:hypothetical protein